MVVGARCAGVAPGCVACTPLVGTCVQACCAAGARVVVAGVRCAGVAQGGVAYTSLVNAYVQACAATGARAVVPGVRDAGVAPNDRAYNSLAGAGPGPQRTSTHGTVGAIQIHLT